MSYIPVLHCSGTEDCVLVIQGPTVAQIRIISYPQCKETAGFSETFSPSTKLHSVTNRRHTSIILFPFQILSLYCHLGYDHVSAWPSAVVFSAFVYPSASTCMDGNEKPRGLSVGYKTSWNEDNRFANCIFKLLPLLVMILHS